MWTSVLQESVKFGIVALADTDSEAVEAMKLLAERAAAEVGVWCKILRSRQDIQGTVTNPGAACGCQGRRGTRFPCAQESRMRTLLTMLGLERFQRGC